MKRKNTSKIFHGVALAAEILAVLAVFVFFQGKLARYEKYEGMISAIEKVRANAYSDSYKCLDFSSDLYSILKRQGIGSRIDIVRQAQQLDAYHAVVSVQIDPQDGKIVDYEKVDSCTMQDGRLMCENGSVEDKNLYIAGKK